MPALTRKFKKIFGKDSANNGVFGSAAALAPATSTNPETIESLPAFLNGWDDATEGGLKLPTLQDMQGLKYDTDYHLAYIYENGMQVYNSLTTYYTNNLVREDATGKIWKSLVDNNIENALVEGANWTLLGDLSNIPTSPIVDASTILKGIVELLTNAELAAGTDTTRAATAAAIASLYPNIVIGSQNSISFPIKDGGAFKKFTIKSGVTGNLSSGNPGTTITFASAFTGGVTGASVATTTYTGVAEANNAIPSLTLSNIVLTVGGNTPQPYRWMVFGYDN